MKRAAVAVVMVVVVISGLYLLLGGSREREAGGTLDAKVRATAVVRRGSLRIIVLAHGKIAAKNSEKVFHVVDGRLTITEIVPEGKVVDKDEVLVRFDDGDLKEKEASQEADYQSAITAMEIAETELEIIQRENLSLLRQAKDKLEAAHLELEKYEKGEMPRTERELLLKIEQAESMVRQKKESYEAIIDPELVKQGFVTPLQVEEERMSFRSSEINLELAGKALEVFRTYTTKVSLNRRRAELASATASLEKTQTVTAIRTKQKKADLEQKKERVRQLKTRLEKTRERIAGTVLPAPVGGLVVYGDPSDRRWWRKADYQVGTVVSRNRVIITIPDMTQTVANVAVAEVDISKVAVGMTARATSEAYAELELTGTVSKVANVPTKEGWWAASNNFEVVIDLASDELEMKPGVTAKTEIEVKHLQDVLSVPVSAIFNHEGQSIVYVQNGEIAARAVELGEASSTRVEVHSGLSEGDTVLLYEPEDVKPPPAPEASQEVPAGEEDRERERVHE